MFFGAVLSPILLIILFNTVVSCVVTVISVRHARNRQKARKMSLKAQKKLSIPPGESCKLVFSLLGVNVLLGLTWILSLLTLVGTGDSVEAAFVVRFLFVFFNSFQGFFIFLFFVALTADARTPWLQRLCPCLKIEDQSTKQSRLYSSRMSVISRKSSTSSLGPMRKTSTSSLGPARQDSITLQMGAIGTIVEEEEEEEDPVVTAINEDALQTTNSDDTILTNETTADTNPLITE